MLSARDITGLMQIMHTPCKPGADGWQVEDSIDYQASEDAASKYIKAGVKGIALSGTSDERAALLWEEKLSFTSSVVEVARKRVPIFAGATALGTKEVIRQLKAFKGIGAEGAKIGLPLWQTPTLENSIQFFADLSEAVPDMAIMVYANVQVFKSAFPTLFWEGIAKRAPAVVTTKYGGRANLLEDLRVAGHQINILPGEIEGMYQAYKMAGDRITAGWSVVSACGPEPFVAMADAIRRKDGKKMEEIRGDFKSVPSAYPPGEPERSVSYYAQASKARTNAAGFINVGPSRAPYRDLPDEWREKAEAAGRAVAELRKKYVKIPTT
jgi:trans-o-hydroxybenzylidenepyruvate hydratase-aldolase